MSILNFILSLVPSSFAIPVPSQTVSFDLSGHKISLTTPALVVTITKG